MTPAATRFKLRLDERYAWFRNEWFFKWHHIGGQRAVEIDQFNGRHAHYAGITFSGSAHDIYWDAIVRGVRKEIVEQLAWVEDAVRAYSPVVAERAIDECAGQLIGFARSVRRTAVEKDRILRGNGTDFPAECDFGHWDGTDAPDILAQAEALKQALFPARTNPHPVPPEEPLSQPVSRPYQVALSFAGEQRDYVRAVAEALSARHIAVFYDEFEAVTLWGKDGAEHFQKVFAQDAQYVVMFISADYVAKSWTRQERRAALSRQIESDEEYVLPVRFDHTPVPGFPTTLQYLEATKYTPAQLAVLIAAKIGLSPTTGKASDMPPPASRSMSGEVTFDYGAFNGRFVIGSGPTEFETKWSKASDTSIHLYNDPASINGIAIAKGATAFDQITDASSYDFTSRSRTPQVGEIAVLLNVNGFYAAVQILHVDDDTRGATADALTIRYAIQADGASGF
ncbi:MAG: TIR domain-containing protein [Pseudomonadota bacterium]